MTDENDTNDDNSIDVEASDELGDDEEVIGEMPLGDPDGVEVMTLGDLLGGGSSGEEMTFEERVADAVDALEGEHGTPLGFATVVITDDDGAMYQSFSVDNESAEESRFNTGMIIGKLIERELIEMAMK